MARKRLRMVAATTEGYLKVGAAKLRAQLVDVRRGAGTLVKRAKEWRRRRHPAVVAAPTTPPAARTTPPAAPVAPAASGTATGPTANRTESAASPIDSPLSSADSRTDSPTGSADSPTGSADSPTGSADSPTGSADGPTAGPGTDSVPDDSWTVAGLRAEARRRGMSGYSRKTKAQLLADLRG